MVMFIASSLMDPTVIRYLRSEQMTPDQNSFSDGILMTINGIYGRGKAVRKTTSGLAA